MIFGVDARRRMPGAVLSLLVGCATLTSWLPGASAAQSCGAAADILGIVAPSDPECVTAEAGDPAPKHDRPPAHSKTAATTTASSPASASKIVTAPQPPPIEEYLIGPDDVLDIEVFQVPDLTRTVRVNSRGDISIPLVGHVHAGGLTTQALEAYLARKLGEEYLQDPQVSVFIKEFANRQQITVEGNVHKPGILPIRGDTTLLQVMAEVGGPDDMANVDRVTVYRRGASGKREEIEFDLAAIREGKATDPVMEANDMVVVHEHKGRAALRDFRSIFSFGLLR